MRIFNLTDVATPELLQHKLVNATIGVGRNLLAPGAMVESAEDEMTHLHLEHFISIGAVSVGTLPPAYALAKDKMSKAVEAEKVSEKPVKAKK